MFEVGKRVIAIRNHSQGLFKRGQVFELLAIRKSKCKCPYADLNIGFHCEVKSDNYWQSCAKCGSKWDDGKDPTIWVDSRGFAPYDDTLSELTDHDIMYNEKVIVN